MRDDCSGKDEVRLRLYRIERAVIDADRRLLSVIVGRSWMRAKRFVGMRTDMGGFENRYLFENVQNLKACEDLARMCPVRSACRHRSPPLLLKKLAFFEFFKL